MQDMNFNPRDYECLTDLSGNERATLMIHAETKKLIVRKAVSGTNRDLYRQLIHVSHKNLVRILGVEEAGSCCYTYEEYINGKTLAEVLASGPVPEKTAFDWIGQLCAAVKVLHRQTPVIIHRDIKPGNVLLTTDGVVKLIDFDAAKAFSPDKQRDTELIGTPDYAAPEQYGFAPSDARTDIYAIGILYHELITGHKPNENETPYNGRYKHIIRNCTALDPKKRYRSVRELEYQFGLRGISRIIGIIPGFRTGVWWKKLIAFVVYAAAVTCAISTVYEDPKLALLGCLVTLSVPPYLLITNPLGFREKLPLLRSRSVPLKVLGIALYILMWFLLFDITLVIYAGQK